MNHYDEIKEACAKMVMNILDVDNPPNTDVEYYKQMELCKSPEYTQKVASLVIDICDNGSEPNSFMRNYVDVVRKQAAQGHGYSQRVLADITDSFFKVAGDFEMDFHEVVKAASAVKEATSVAGVGALSSALARLGIGAAPGVVRTLLAGGAGLGVGLGGMHWLLNKDTREDQEDVEVLRAKIDAHDRLQRDLRREMSRKGMVPSIEG